MASGVVSMELSKIYTRKVTVTTSGSGGTSGRAIINDPNVTVSSRVMVSRISTGWSSVLLAAYIPEDGKIQIGAYNTDSKSGYNGTFDLVYLIDNR